VLYFNAFDQFLESLQHFVSRLIVVLFQFYIFADEVSGFLQNALAQLNIPIVSFYNLRMLDVVDQNVKHLSAVERKEGLVFSILSVGENVFDDVEKLLLIVSTELVLGEASSIVRLFEELFAAGGFILLNQSLDFPSEGFSSVVSLSGGLLDASFGFAASLFNRALELSEALALLALLLVRVIILSLLILGDFSLALILGVHGVPSFTFLRAFGRFALLFVLLLVLVESSFQIVF